MPFLVSWWTRTHYIALMVGVIPRLYSLVMKGVWWNSTCLCWVSCLFSCKASRLQVYIISYLSNIEIWKSHNQENVQMSPESLHTRGLGSENKTTPRGLPTCTWLMTMTVFSQQPMEGGVKRQTFRSTRHVDVQWIDSRFRQLHTS